MAPYGGSAPLGEAATLEEVPPEWGNLLPEADFRCQIEGELPFLRKIVRRWYRNRSEAEDLIQDTLLLALANAARFQPGSDLRAWLFTIMRNQFFAGNVKAQRFVLAFDDIAAVMMPSPTSSPEARLLVRDIDRALRRLPTPQQTAIRLIGIEGKSYAEAAHLMGTSIAAVRCHLARARERLRNTASGRETTPNWTERRKVGRTPSQPVTQGLSPSAPARIMSPNVTDARVLSLAF